MSKIIFLVFVFISCFVFSQEDNFELKEEQTPYFSFENNIFQDEENLLDYLQKNPLNLNTATYHKLKLIPYLDEDEILKLLNTKDISFVDKKVDKYVKIAPSTKKLTGKITTRVTSNSYIFNRTQILYKDEVSTGYTFLRKPEEAPLRFSNLNYFLRKWWFRFSNKNIDNLIVGNYKAHFAEGIVFSKDYPIQNFINTINQKPSGLEEDKSIYDNAHLYGVGLEKKIKNFLFSLFYSNKTLFQVELSTQNGRTVANEDLLELRKKEADFITTHRQSVVEDLVGFNFKFFSKKFKVGSCGYHAVYSIPFDPDKTNTSGYNLSNKYSERWNFVFRGNKLTVGSFYFEWSFKNFLLFEESAFSFSQYEDIDKKSGYATNLGFITKLKNLRTCLAYVYLSENFFSPLGQPIKIYDYPNSQTGLKFINELNIKSLKIYSSLSVGKLLGDMWSGHYLSEQPRYPSDYSDIFVRVNYKVHKNIELSLNAFSSFYDKYLNLKNYNLSVVDEYIQTKQLKFSTAYKLTYEILQPIKLSFCYNKKLIEFFELKKQLYGEQLFCEVSYKIPNFNLSFRFCVFDADKNVYLSYLKPQWKDFYIYEYENTSFGDKLVLSFSYKISTNFIFWTVYENKTYSLKQDISSICEVKTINTTRFQLEFLF